MDQARAAGRALGPVSHAGLQCPSGAVTVEHNRVPVFFELLPQSEGISIAGIDRCSIRQRAEQGYDVASSAVSYRQPVNMGAMCWDGGALADSHEADRH